MHLCAQGALGLMPTSVSGAARRPGFGPPVKEHAVAQMRHVSFRACVGNGYKALAPFLIYSAALVVVVLYALADQLHSFLCRIFMPQYHYPYAAPLALMQVLLKLLMLLGLHALGLVRLSPFSCKLAEQLMIPAVSGSAQSVLALWAQANAHSGLYPLLSCLLPLFSLAWCHLLGQSKPGSAYFTRLLSAVTFTSIGITVSKGLYTIEPLEYFYSPLSLFLHSLSLAWLAKVAQYERGHAAMVNIYYTLTVTQTILLTLLCLMHPDTLLAISDGSWHSLIFLGYMLGMLLLGAALCLIVDATALGFSPFTAALLHSARGLTMPLLNLL